MDFGANLAQAILREDGISASRLLSITNPQLIDLGNSKSEAEVANDVRRQSLGDNSSKEDLMLWTEIAVAHWRVAVQVAYTQNLQAAYTAQNSLLVAVNRAADRTDNWILPVLFLVAKELRQLSIMADVQKKKSEEGAIVDTGGSTTRTLTANLEEATRSINRSFTLCLNDRNPILEQTRKWGVYFFVGELFKIYFKLNKRALAKSVLKVLQNMQQQLPPLEKFPRSHSVTFLYYTGVLLFIDEDYVGAKEKLTQAFAMCHKKATKNKEYILMYLIPAQLLTSKRRTPSQQLWDEFSNLEVVYKPLVTAVLTGDLKLFDSEMSARRRLFVKKYIYLAMEKVRVLVTTQLFRKVYLVQDKATRIPTEVFCLALKYSLTREGFVPVKDEDIDEDAKEEDEKSTPYSKRQVEGHLAQLIYSGQMKGYVSRDRQMVVLSNKDAFPRVHNRGITC